MFGLPLWAIWLILCGVFLLIEIFNISFLLIWPGIGAFFAFVTSLLTDSIEIQIAVFVISTTLMIIFMKPLVKKLFKTKDNIKTNSDAIIGKKGVVVKEIIPLEQNGQVKVAGQLWSAITNDESQISINEIIKVIKVDGVKLVVVQIAYMIIPIAIFLVVIAISSQLSGGWAALLIVIGFLIALIAGIIAYLMLQIGVCHMIYNDGQLSKAFAFSEIKEIIDEIGWFDCILTYVGLVIITCVISTVVSTIIGFVFTAFGFSGLMLGINTSGVFLLGMLINISVAMFFVGPYLSIFNSRSIGLLYSLHL